MSTPTLEAVQFLSEVFRPAPPERVGFRLWDGTVWPDERSREAIVVLPHPGSLRSMFEGGTEMALAEAFLRGDFDIEGSTESAFELADLLARRGPENWLASVRRFYRLHRLPTISASTGLARAYQRNSKDPAQHSLENDRQAVTFHYDLSNDFYRLWLDQRMVYSCAYFERPEADIDEAQEAKLHHLCRKLRLQPGCRLLDIGCGWGGLAIFAAKNYGAVVTGITLSSAQAEFATARVNEAGLARRVQIKIEDYRSLKTKEAFDAIVSVGMSEHVGRDHLADYFQTAGRLLCPGGVFLNHAIGEGGRPRPRTGPSFIDEYVFPDSDVPPIPVVLQAAESAGLEVRDVENLREHYALTLRHWVARLEAAHAHALGFVDEATFRVWRLYMAGSAHAFARGHLSIYQALLSKPDSDGRSHLPLTRSDWYVRPNESVRQRFHASLPARII
jgi:cyclopropane-fatty-acyl-phospholipid synthase